VQVSGAQRVDVHDPLDRVVAWLEEGRDELRCENEGMRYATAVRRLHTVAEDCDRVNGLLEEGFLAAVYAYGPVLDGNTTDLPIVHVAFAVRLPAEELPWGVEPPGCAGLAHLLRLDKAPVTRRWRPAAHPVWNHEIRRPLQIWTPGGTNTAALKALAAGHAQNLRMPAPSPEEEAARYKWELALSFTHLRAVRDRYWDDREWRRVHHGDGRRPEEHLWQAVDGYLDLLDHPPGRPSR
jgi:hypothetical protein